jgi:hypothetical protein
MHSDVQLYEVLQLDVAFVVWICVFVRLHVVRAGMRLGNSGVVSHSFEGA